jgi:hypothetical protein
MQWPTLQPGGTQAVVGEASYAEALERIAHGRTWGGTRTRWFTACLSRDDANPHDADAVRVDIGGDTVGYLPRTDAPGFHAVLERLRQEQQVATARARLTGGWERGPYGRGAIGVMLDIDPRRVQRRRDAPFLPPGTTVLVVQDEDATATLEQFLGDSRSIEVTASLEPATEPPETLRVSVAGREVGMVTGVIARVHLPVVGRVLARGFPATCAATIERRRRGPAVRLQLPRPDTV